MGSFVTKLGGVWKFSLRTQKSIHQSWMVWGLPVRRNFAEQCRLKIIRDVPLSLSHYYLLDCAWLEPLDWGISWTSSNGNVLPSLIVVGTWWVLICKRLGGDSVETHLGHRSSVEHQTAREMDAYHTELLGRHRRHVMPVVLALGSCSASLSAWRPWGQLSIRLTTIVLSFKRWRTFKLRWTIIWINHVYPFNRRETLGIRCPYTTWLVPINMIEPWCSAFRIRVTIDNIDIAQGRTIS